MEPTTLADAALLHPQSVARILKELTQRGLIGRTRHPDDGRRAVVSLDPLGAELVRTASQQTASLLEAYELGFGAERMALLLAELRALIEAVDNATDPSRCEKALSPPTALKAHRSHTSD
jgi:DNA-binding MarR family transcriptional regulator